MSVDVHANISEANAQWLQVQGACKLRGSYTGERLGVRKEQAIINALANGEPIERIARRLRCSKHTRWLYANVNHTI